MSGKWLEITAAGVTTKVDLNPGLTRVGGPESDVVLHGWSQGEVHVWDEPPKAIYIGAPPGPTIGGAEFEERALAAGDQIIWCGVRIELKSGAPVLEEIAPAPVLEEIPPAAPAAAPKAKVSRSAPAAAPSAPAPSTPATTNDRIANRVRAGLMVELGLADRNEARRWQDAVIRREFNADACAREILARSTVDPSDSRLVERSERLMRDLVMAPMQSGAKSAGRKMRGAARGGAAFLVAQLIVVGIFSILVLLFMIFVHIQWPPPEFSFDEFLSALIPWEE